MSSLQKEVPYEIVFVGSNFYLNERKIGFDKAFCVFDKVNTEFREIIA